MNLRHHLDDLAYNLRWAWHAPTWNLFRDLSPEIWEETQHNPVALLRRLDPETLQRPELEARVQERWDDLQAYRNGDTWYQNGNRDPAEPLVAYFSAEFGLTESLHIYSGGLGVLAGDHLKSASDLGIPLVAVSLLYREGYFEQRVVDGRQVERFPVADFEDLPVRPVERDGAPVTVRVPFPGRQVTARVWRADVGRVRLYLLDADVPENIDDDRRLTARLYGGAEELRISQEILLGMGGYRALETLGISPETFHMNEGHSALLSLELTRDIMADTGVDFPTAREEARSRCVFTTHTPVPAGHDRFSRELVARYLTDAAHGLGLDVDTLMELGRAQEGEGLFNMTVLAIRMARAVNGVSALHGAVSRKMFQPLWPDRPVQEVPVGHITNGIHLRSWVHPDVADTYGTDPDGLGLGAPAPAPEPEALWRIHQERRRDLVNYVAGHSGHTLDPEALTVAFARRFATYKRATLLLSDLDRLDRIVNAPGRPVQFVFAGKAHPRDQGGKALIARIHEVAEDPRFQGRVAFLPGYGIDVARALVQGADVWLNNPRRPMEASGTSGMKAAMNGVLNLSILDGWWDEAWRDRDPDAPDPGWAIGDGTGEGEAADQADANALYSALEEGVIPLFYRRDDGMPREWVAHMVESIRQVAPVFNTHRMLADYTERYRTPVASG